MELKLEDLKPKTGTFRLSHLPDEVIELNPITLDDEIWLRQKYGDEIEAIFKQLRMREICEIAYRLMKDKSILKKREVKFYNDEGEEITESIGGIKLLMALVSGYDEKIEIIKALMETVGVSRPMLDKMIVDEEEKKSQLTGPKSSTSSPMNTDGQPSTS